MTRDNQDRPVTNDREYCQDTLLPVFQQAVTDSKTRGVAEYGTALQPFNGRDAVRDTFEEWVDLGMYLEQIKRERTEVIDILLECYEAARVMQNLQLGRRIRVAVEGMGGQV